MRRLFALACLAIVSLAITLHPAPQTHSAEVSVCYICAPVHHR